MSYELLENKLKMSGINKKNFDITGGFNKYEGQFEELT